MGAREREYVSWHRREMGGEHDAGGPGHRDFLALATSQSR